MTPAPNILVVDDHPEIRSSVARFLERNGMRATAAKDAQDMDRALARERFDLVVLDIMMPGEDGISVCRRLRAAGDIAILLLSAMGDGEDRIRGLDMGADDYLAKPFDPRELVSRIRAVLRRTEAQSAAATPLAGKRVRFAHLELDVDRGTLASKDGVTHLTSGELAFLCVMLERPRITLKREDLALMTTGRDLGPLDRTIDNQVSRLRRKIEPDILRPAIIRTVRNKGYCLSCDVVVVE